jgi:hypothetical protein
VGVDDLGMAIETEFGYEAAGISNPTATVHNYRH